MQSLRLMSLSAPPGVACSPALASALDIEALVPDEPVPLRELLAASTGDSGPLAHCQYHVPASSVTVPFCGFLWPTACALKVHARHSEAGGDAGQHQTGLRPRLIPQLRLDVAEEICQVRQHF